MCGCGGAENLMNTFPSTFVQPKWKSSWQQQLSCLVDWKQSQKLVPCLSLLLLECNKLALNRLCPAWISLGYKSWKLYYFLAKNPLFSFEEQAEIFASFLWTNILVFHTLGFSFSIKLNSLPQVTRETLDVTNVNWNFDGCTTLIEGL